MQTPHVFSLGDKSMDDKPALSAPENWASGVGRHPRNTFFRRVRNDAAPPGKEICTAPGTYWLQCLGCAEAYDAGLTSTAPQIIGGNSKNLDRHLRQCAFFDQSKFVWKSTAPTKAEMARGQEFTSTALNFPENNHQQQLNSPLMSGWKRGGKKHPRNEFFQRVRNDAAEEGKEIHPCPGTYWSQCTCCIRAYVGGLTNKAPQIMIGNSKTLDRHLKKCQFFDKSNFTWQTTAKSRAKSFGVSQPVFQGGPEDEGRIEIPDQQGVARGSGLLETRAPLLEARTTEAPPKKKRKSSPSTFALVAPVQQRKKPATIGSYMHRKPGKEEANKFHDDLVDFIAENDLECHLVKSFSFHKMIMHLRPDVESNCLDINANQMESIIEDRAAVSDKANVEAVIDAVSKYKGVLPGLSTYKFFDSEQILMKCLFASASTASAIVGIEPTVDGQDGLSLAKEIEGQIQGAKSSFSGMQVGSYCTNDSGGYGKARRILSLRFPFILFTCDFSHQLDCLSKDLLTNCSAFSSETDEALVAIQFLMSSRGRQWMERLTEIENEIYGMSCKLHAPVYSDWKSLQTCLASILRVRLACELVHIRHCHEDDFPEALACFGRGDDFWSNAQSAHDTIVPVVRSSFLVDVNGVTMSDATFIFVAIFQALEGNEIAQEQVERRWRQLEVPIYILAFCLDPKYARYAKPFLIAQNRSRSLFTVDDLSRAAAAYYAMLFLRKHELKQIRKACKTYFNAIIAGDDGELDLDDMSSRHFSTFWQEQTGDWYILGILAKRLLSTIVHSPEADTLRNKLGFRHLKSKSSVGSELSSARVKCKHRVSQEQKERNKRGNTLPHGEVNIADPDELPRLTEANNANEVGENEAVRAGKEAGGEPNTGNTTAVSEKGTDEHGTNDDIESSLTEAFKETEVRLTNFLTLSRNADCSLFDNLSSALYFGH
uniref:DUF659 domain-containing protein n=1 Tax=Odontella aurita TaxID=265563 RepID=A0A7S4J9G6_9STRA|mmetsp:Transcript_42028/g.127452  ORF Transcript_42028/g.127452 Transcript_42028/m.127452 type:complete len:939 (+) Transcript_42028:116-2932(+)